jgi:hypothetical protein
MLRLPRALAPCALVTALAAPGVVAMLPVHPADALGDALAIAWGHASDQAADALTGEVAHAAAQSATSTPVDTDSPAEPERALDESVPWLADDLPREPFDPDAYACSVPRADVAPADACADGADYPACTWRIPDANDPRAYHGIWRNTVAEHRRGRPALVALLLATSTEYARRFPGERVVIGDLDAPGPRHETHEHGVDADLYLTGAMEVENLPGNELVENYLTLPDLFRHTRQGRVQALARALAACSGGRLRILYNDVTVRRAFLAWYRERDLDTPFGAPIRAHNDLHRFHFHVTVPEDLDVLPFEGDARTPEAGDALASAGIAPTDSERR